MKRPFAFVCDLPPSRAPWRIIARGEELVAVAVDHPPVAIRGDETVNLVVRHDDGHSHAFKREETGLDRTKLN